jgi:hypothetical protein
MVQPRARCHRIVLRVSGCAPAAGGGIGVDRTRTTTARSAAVRLGAGRRSERERTGTARPAAACEHRRRSGGTVPAQPHCATRMPVGWARPTGPCAIGIGTGARRAPETFPGVEYRAASVAASGNAASEGWTIRRASRARRREPAEEMLASAQVLMRLYVLLGQIRAGNEKLTTQPQSSDFTRSLPVRSWSARCRPTAGYGSPWSEADR